MHLSLFKYFYKFIFFNRTRQKLIFLSIVGLLISSFSLTVLQGVMGGLQNGLVTRSKNVAGHAHVDITDLTREESEELARELDEAQVKFVPELELELMIQNQNYVSPVIMHGMNYNKYVPAFLQNKDRDEVVIGSELGHQIRSHFGSRVVLTSPAHTDILFQEIPRQAMVGISDFYTSELPEIDQIHGWVRASFLQNMIRQLTYNRYRIFQADLSAVKELAQKYQVPFISWEQEHSTLVYALGMETKVMLFLFIGASLLVGICITSGFLIFYNKIKVDLASFWILGLSKDRLLSLIYSFGQSLSIIFCLLGVLLGVGFLLILKHNQIVIMPEHFVERNIPVRIEYMHMLIAFFVPYVMASLFTHFTFKAVQKRKLLLYFPHQKGRLSH